MKRRELGDRSGLWVSELGLGCMGMSEFYGPSSETDAFATLAAAVEHGIDFLDTSDQYGRGANEEFLARFIRSAGTPVIIATKFGIRRADNSEDRIVDNSPAYVRAACEASLRRLGVEVIDLYYCHRRNRATPVEDMVGAMADLVRQGKVRHLGLSEVSAATLRAAHAVHPIAAVQTEYSLWSREPEEGVLKTCEELGVGFVAYSPLGRGFLTGKLTIGADDVRRGLPRFQGAAAAQNQALVQRLEQFAGERGRTAAQIALAWLLHKSKRVVPIFGARRRERLHENAAAAELVLTGEDVASLDDLFQAGSVHGERYTDAGMRWIERPSNA
jgi:aryl-alcohol dehydrogenase-like predicted oxidoreductase